ncbi:MAG: ABC transporter permease [Ilumatobacteraceae bacterium]|nr:ABC transporter permease [Ilumatobacteraceae bacterium]
MNVVRSVGLIARRELLTRVRSRSFQLGSLVIVLAGVLVVIAPQLLPEPDGPEWTIAVTGQAPPGTQEALQLLDDSDPATISIRQTDTADADALAAGDDVDAVIINANEIVVDASADDRLAALLTTAVRQADLIAENAEGAARVSVREVGEVGDDDARQVVGFAGVLALFVAIVTYCGWILNSVLEEKSNRVVEIIVSTVHPRELLAGKVIGNGIAGLIQFCTVVAVVAAAAAIAGNLPDLPGGVATSTVGVVGWFLLGFTLYAVGYAAAGSLVSRQADAQSAQSPMLAVVMIGYFAGLFVVNPDPSSTLSVVLSLLPPFAPFAMPVRIAAGDAQLWEVGVATVLTVATIWAMIRLAGRIYMNAILRTGARVPIRDALRRPSMAR